MVNFQRLPSHTGPSCGHPGRQTGLHGPRWLPSRGSRFTCRSTLRATAGPENALPPGPEGALRPSTPRARPASLLMPSGSECAARSGDPTGQRRPGDTYMEEAGLFPDTGRRRICHFWRGWGKCWRVASRHSESLGTGSRAVQGTEKPWPAGPPGNKLEVPPPHTRGRSVTPDGSWPRPLEPHDQSPSVQFMDPVNSV